MGLFDRISDEIEAKEKMEGLSPIDLLDMSRDLRNLVQALARRGESTLATIAGRRNDAGLDLWSRLHAPPTRSATYRG